MRHKTRPIGDGQTGRIAAKGRRTSRLEQSLQVEVLLPEARRIVSNPGMWYEMTVVSNLRGVTEYEKE